MFYLSAPSDERVCAMLRQLSAAPFSYAAVGSTKQSLTQAPAGFQLDVYGSDLGHGDAVFERARDALSQIANYPPSFTRVVRVQREMVAGALFATIARHMGFSSVHPCRVIYVLDEQQPRRFGFGFGTLPGHAESGEERFLVTQADDGAVHYSVQAFSRPIAWLARLGAPLARGYQLRFQRETLAQMQRLCRAAAYTSKAISS